MARFTNLRDLCTDLEEELENDSSQPIRTGQSYDEEIANKMKDLKLFSSKLRLLQGKYISMNPDRPGPSSEEMTMAEYEDTAMWKVLEEKTVNTVTQFHDVRQLINTPDSELEPLLIERKQNIISKLKEYRLKEEELRAAEAKLKKAEEEHSVLRAKWDEELGSLRDMSDQAKKEEEISQEGRLYNKLQTLIKKMEMMRWLIKKLVTAPSSSYDWLTDPDNRFEALKQARPSNTMEDYMEM